MNNRRIQMGKKDQLPAEVHDHFRKANVLHGYVEKSMVDATKNALEIGRELSAAKAAIPHGRWENECERLFDGSARTAQFYMQFSKNIEALPKAQRGAVLMLEGTLVGAAKAAKQAAQKKTPKPAVSTVAEVVEPSADKRQVDLSPSDTKLADAKRRYPDGESLGVVCPSCGIDWWYDSTCGGCLQPLEDVEEPEPVPDETAPTPKTLTSTQAKNCLKQWSETVRHMMSDRIGIDSFREAFPGPAGDRVIDAAKELYEALGAWKKGIK
jgi:hypothetical protein